VSSQLARRCALSAAILLIPALSAAQSPEWTAYLSPEVRTVAREAVISVVQSLDAWDESGRRYDRELRDLYVAARRERWSSSEYRRRLQEVRDRSPDFSALAGNSERLGLSLGTLRAILAEEPPALGTREFRAADTWLRAVSRRQGARIVAVEILLEDVAGVSQTVSDEAVRAVIADLAFPLPETYSTASPPDQLAQAMGTWWLAFLCRSRDEERADAADRLAAHLQRISPELESQAVGIAAQYRRSAERRGAISGAIRDSLHVITARTAGGSAPGAAELSGVLTAIADSDRADLLAIATVDRTARFGMEILERLLSSLSDRQRLRLALQTGRGPGDVHHIASRLYLLRLDLVRPAIDGARTAVAEARTEFRRGSNHANELLVLEAYRLEGERYVDGLAPWITGGATRAGDSYTWALMSVLSNRYAQRLILTGPGYEDTQRLVGEFVTRVYREVEARLADLGLRIARYTLFDVPDSFDRVYDSDAGSTPGGEAADLVYREFVRATQGDDFIAQAFAAGEQSVIREWAHTHGLHVTGARGVSVAIVIQDVVQQWFDSANRADNDLQAIGFAVRAVGSLAVAMHRSLDPAVREAGVSSLAVYEPRLFVAQDLLSEDALFDNSPGEVLSGLYALYPGVGDIQALIESIAGDVGTLLDRLADVERADIRVLRGEGG
jgi:hypothetical protein